MLIAASEMIKGMAIVKPNAVVIRAKEMSFASAVGSGAAPSPAPASLANAAIIPKTVPNRPIIGADLITVLTQLIRNSRSVRMSR